jgi:uncharacterized protein (UPF0332 family)
MSDGTQAESFLAIAEESLAGAVSEYANGRYRNCANRAYYAVFQAAIEALLRNGIGLSPRDRQWRHDAVRAQFSEQLINRRKLYPSALRDGFARAASLRVKADYTPDKVSEAEARHVLRRGQDFFQAIRNQGG